MINFVLHYGCKQVTIQPVVTKSNQKQNFTFSFYDLCNNSVLEEEIRYFTFEKYLIDEYRMNVLICLTNITALFVWVAAVDIKKIISLIFLLSYRYR